MTTTVAQPVASAPSRLIRWVRDMIVGTLLCLTPVTALLALGWQMRAVSRRIDTRWGRTAPAPGWLLGPRGSGWAGRLAGGMAANIRMGLSAALGLAALTLPFTVLWLGAWWAGWENSFNKGYEQAAVGPIVWMIGTVIALPVLAHLPLALAHAAYEGRVTAFFEVRRIRSLAAASGWRIVWLALLGALFVVPFFGMRALPVFVEGIVPGFAAMTGEAQAQVALGFQLFDAGLAFVLMLFFKLRAAATYAVAAPRAAAGRRAALWEGHPAQDATPKGRDPWRVSSTVWLLIACVVWLALPVAIVFGQFMNYDPALWLTHPLFLLPWAG